MSTYAIGDVQGCYDPLMRLLDKIHFDKEKDQLWFTGDLVNRGPNSLKTVRFVKSLNTSAITVLGNHDLTLLAVGYGTKPYNANYYTFNDILEAPDRDSFLSWFKTLPLIHHDPKLGFSLVHAGFHPLWDLTLALKLAKEVETILQGPESLFHEFLKHLYGNEPDTWDLHLTGWDRIRFIVNCFTRMRFCNEAGKLEFLTKESAHAAPPGFSPWFQIPNRKTKEMNIIFGHWAALEGHTNTPKVFALDTGCVWGNCLTALRLEDQQRYTVDCK